jgi:predicted transposase/invertase (TIGR01784 family)
LAKHFADTYSRIGLPKPYATECLETCEREPIRVGVSKCNEINLSAFWSTTSVGHRTIDAGANGQADSMQESNAARNQTNRRFRVQEGFWQSGEHPRSDRDIRARDSAGRWLNIEMQVTVFTGLLQRMIYYACTMYVAQLDSGQNYTALRSAISICLLNKELFRADTIPHHRFRLADPEHGMEVSDSIEVHTLELTKYNLQEETISSAPAIEQWAFFFLFADEYEPERLRGLLPGVEFQQAISVVEAIAARTEDRMMYDQRLKAQRDYQWGLDSAREEGRQEGWEGGELSGRIRTLQELLGDEPSSTATLRERTISELSGMLTDLQQRLRSRQS